MQMRKVLNKASHLQIRTLIVLLANVVLQKVPVTESILKVFKNSRKKKLLRLHFASWSKVKSLLHHPGTWTHVMSDLAPLLVPAVGAFFDETN